MVPTRGWRAQLRSEISEPLSSIFKICDCSSIGLKQLICKEAYWQFISNFKIKQSYTHSFWSPGGLPINFLFLLACKVCDSWENGEVIDSREEIFTNRHARILAIFPRTHHLVLISKRMRECCKHTAGRWPTYVVFLPLPVSLVHSILPPVLVELHEPPSQWGEPAYWGCERGSSPHWAAWCRRGRGWDNRVCGDVGVLLVDVQPAGVILLQLLRGGVFLPRVSRIALIYVGPSEVRALPVRRCRRAALQT
jgi:hypothetical protein